MVGKGTAVAVGAGLLLLGLAAAKVVRGGVKRNLALTSPIFYRTVMGRMYSFNQWSLPGETPASVGASLATYSPSFVSGLIRLEAGARLTTQMVADYTTVRRYVQASNPSCIFDVWFRPNQYTTTAAMVADMEAVISSGLPFDCFSFNDFGGITSEFQQAAVQNSHAAGKLCLGDGVDGAVSVTPDVGAVADYAFGFPPGLGKALSLNIPVLMHINNGPIPTDQAGETEHYDWVNVIQDDQVSSLVFAGGTVPVTLSHTSFLEQMARAQKDGFAFMFPAFWPAGVVGPPSAYWDPSQAMRTLMQQLAAQFNIPPS